MTSTVNTYFEFEDFTIWSGFDVLTRFLLTNREAGQATPLVEAGVTVGYRCGDLGFLLKRRAETAAIQQAIAVANQLTVLFVLNDKYQWWQHQLVGGELLQVGKGKKPKHLAARLVES
jgi:hypothetical protein